MWVFALQQCGAMSLSVKPPVLFAAVCQLAVQPVSQTAAAERIPTAFLVYKLSLEIILSS